MPLFVFKVRKDSQPVEIAEIELADVDAARTEAATLMGEELKDGPQDIWTDRQWSVEVTDAEGRSLFTVSSSASASEAPQPNRSSPTGTVAGSQAGAGGDDA